MPKSLLLVISVCLLSSGCAGIGSSGGGSSAVHRLPLVGKSIQKREFDKQVENDPFPSANQSGIRVGS